MTFYMGLAGLAEPDGASGKGSSETCFNLLGGGPLDMFWNYRRIRSQNYLNNSN